MSFPENAQPRTITVPGAGAQTLSFELPPGVILKPESVIASVTAGASAAAPKLTITSPGGAVIARKVQGDTIDAGASGSATWALRLDDESAATGGAAIAWAQAWRDTSRGDVNQVITSGTLTRVKFRHFYTSDQAAFATGTAAAVVVNAVDDEYLILRQRGIYWLAGTAFFDSVSNFGREVNAAVLSTAHLDKHGSTPDMRDTLAASPFGSSTWERDDNLVFVSAPPTVVPLEVVQTSGVNKNLGAGYLGAAFLASAATQTAVYG